MKRRIFNILFALCISVTLLSASVLVSGNVDEDPQFADYESFAAYLARGETGRIYIRRADFTVISSNGPTKK